MDVSLARVVSAGASVAGTSVGSGAGSSVGSGAGSAVGSGAASSVGAGAWGGEVSEGSPLSQAIAPRVLRQVALGLAGADRVPNAAVPVAGTNPTTRDFHPLDDEAFPAVRLAREAGSRGGTAPAVYNAANERCVQAFREGALPFVGIVDVVEQVLTSHDVGLPGPLTVEDVFAADAWARAAATDLLESA